MRHARPMSHRVQRTALIALAAGLVLAGCDTGPLGPEPRIATPEPDIGATDAAFATESESLRTFDFEASGAIDGEWEGAYRDPDAESSGTLTVETRSAAPRGEMLYLAQVWTFHPPDPIHPPDPVEPVSVTLEGALDLGTGILELKGMTEDGVVVHARGEAEIARTELYVRGTATFES